MKRIIMVALSTLICASTGTFAQAKTPDADNTAQNKGALNKNSVTAEKQGNSKSDVEVTATVRKAIMAEKGLSVNAQNVKIIYKSGGLILLRGPVDSTEEKAKVEEIAKGCTGVTGIKSMLTVKAHS